jgi:hypothetical protein
MRLEIHLVGDNHEKREHEKERGKRKDGNKVLVRRNKLRKKNEKEGKGKKESASSYPVVDTCSRAYTRLSI